PDRMQFAVAHDRDNRDFGKIGRFAGNDRGDEQREGESREDPGRPSPHTDIIPQFGEPGDFARRSRRGVVDCHLLSPPPFAVIPAREAYEECRSRRGRSLVVPGWPEGPGPEPRNTVLSRLSQTM